MVTTELQLPPGPRRALGGNPLFGFLAFRRDALGFLTSIARAYGDVVFFRMGPQRVYMLNHPDLLREVLVTHQDAFVKGRALQRAKRLLGEGLLTSEGAHHRRQRRLAQPAFHRQRIETYGATMCDYAARAARRWQAGATFDIAHEMMRLTLAIVSKTLFDADVEADAEDVGRAFTEIMELFQMLMLPYSEYLEKLPLPATRRFERARARLDAVIYRIIEERRRDGTDHGDLLSMLMSAQDVEGDGGRMSDQQLRDELMTIFLAGHETTANALAWTWYLLAAHPEVERKLHAEVDEVCGARDRAAVADYPRLRYTEMVVSEALRLYPPAWVVGRLAAREFQLRDYTVPAGSLVLMSQYVVQRDPRYFPDPARFDPERWTPQAREARPAYAYFPFGGGARRCIGEGFAWLEAVLLVASIARRWRLRLAPAQTVTPLPRITLRPKDGIRMIAEPRG
ncbi:MAG TPA: cytochrome P450 [Pyrinomonadaceae bacterium]|jgi:cytochrome P450